MNDFERVSNEVSKPNFETSSECAIEWARGDKVATVTFPCSNRFNTCIRRLAEEHPDEVQIRHENKDGSIVATIPVKYIKIRAPKMVTDEQKERASERFKQMWKDRNNSLPLDTISTKRD